MSVSRMTGIRAAAGRRRGERRRRGQQQHAEAGERGDVNDEVHRLHPPASRRAFGDRAGRRRPAPTGEPSVDDLGHAEGLRPAAASPIGSVVAVIMPSWCMPSARRWLLVAVLLGLSPALAQPRPAAAAAPVIQASGLRIEMTARAGALWTVAPGQGARACVRAARVPARRRARERACRSASSGWASRSRSGPDVLEHRFRGVLRDDPSLSLELRFRLSDLSPIVRFQYGLPATKPHVFSRSGGEDELSISRRLGRAAAREGGAAVGVRGAVPQLHAERAVAGRAHFDAGLGVMGPILIGSDGRRTLLLAYEHGSQAPDAFVRFDLGAWPPGALRAVKGNYWNGQAVDAEHPFETVWLQAGLVAGDEGTTAEAYRRFVRTRARRTRRLAAAHPLQHLELPGAQQVVERQGVPRLDERGAHARRDRRRAPHGHRDVRARHRLVREDGRLGGEPGALPAGARAPIRKKLDGYGMKLGLWFDPNAAAVSSRRLPGERADVMSLAGETQSLAGVGDRGELPHVPRLALGRGVPEGAGPAARETGVTYFKWDAVGQYGCDAPGHGHGTQANTRRGAARRLRLPDRRCGSPRSRERLGEQVPGALVDFDVTEGGRAVGLAFLTAGRYFLVNNGPYYQNYDVPRSTSTRRTGTCSSTRARRAPGSRARPTATTSGSRRSCS